MRKTTYLLLAVLVMTVAGGLYYFLREEQAPPPQATPVQTDPGAIVTFRGSEIVQEHQGRRQWALSAGTVNVETATKRVILKDIKAVFHQDNGGRIDVTALEGTIDSTTRNIDMEGEIRAVAADGTVLTAKSARWIHDGRKFAGWGGVTVTRQDTVISGDRLDADVNLEKARVSGNARARKAGTP